MPKPICSARYCSATQTIYSTQSATYPCRASRERVMIDSTYEDKLYQTPKFAGAVRYNAQKNCAALSCRALRRVARMCSRTVSGTAYRFRHGSTLCSPTVEKLLCRSPFRSGHMSAICARLSQKEVGVKRVETLVSTLLPCRGARHAPAVGAANPRAPQSATLR